MCGAGLPFTTQLRVWMLLVTSLFCGIQLCGCHICLHTAPVHPTKWRGPTWPGEPGGVCPCSQCSPAIRSFPHWLWCHPAA